MSESHLEIQFSSVPDLPVSAACILCIQQHLWTSCSTLLQLYKCMDATASLAQRGGWLSIDGCSCIDHTPFSLFVLFMRISQNFNEVNGCGFCLSVYERTILCSQDHSGASLVSAIQNPKGPLMRSCFNTKPMYFSIRTKVSVLHREVGRSWEGLLREAP